MSSPQAANDSGFSSLEPSHYATTITTVAILGLFILSFVFLLFIRFIFKQASRSSSVYTTDSSSNSDAEHAPGLDPLIRDMFPTFEYSAVKGWNAGLECAICLSDMEDKDVLRLLTVCCHVFHRQCIDEWFGNHSTCPICRSSLRNPEKHHIMCPLLQQSMLQGTDENEGEQQLGDNHLPVNESTSHDQVAVTIQGDEEAEGGGEKCLKAHSTGHSILMVRENKDDKYKLLLTAPVRAEIAKGHRCVRSCTILGEFSSNAADKGNHSHGDTLP